MPNDSIYGLLSVSKTKNLESFCIIVNYQLEGKELEEIVFYRKLGKQYLKLIEECYGIKSEAKTLKERFEEKKNQDVSGLNEGLIDQLISLAEKDQRYRHWPSLYEEYWEEQNKLDRENEAAIIKNL